VPAERALDGKVAGLAAAAALVCCALPGVLTATAGVTLAGVGLLSWLLVGAGVVAAGAGWWAWAHRRACPSRTREEVSGHADRDCAPRRPAPR
jgi:hypothetical protein